ncbi:MAG: TolC family protein [Paludibacteraceae bacterium]|nr:TolC family protein [Paludibacteraceae bacterium]
METKSFLKKGLFITTCLLFQTSVFGQDSLAVSTEPTDTVLNLDLSQAITIALDQNPTIRVAGMEIEKANYAKKESVANLFPSITATGSYQRTIEKQTMSMAGQSMKIGSDNSWAAGFSAQLPLINVPLWQSIKLTSEAVMEKVEKSRGSKISQVSSVISAYYAVLNAQDSYEVLQKSLNTANENLRITKKRFENGQTSEYDVIQAEVQVRNIQPTLLSCKNGIELAKMQLRVLTNLPADFSIEVKGKLSDYVNDDYRGMMMEELDSSLVDNPNMRLLEVSTTLLERQLKLQKANWYPTLGAQFVYQWTSLNDDFKFADYEWNPYSTLSLSLAWPIFQGGSRIYKQKQAQIALDEMEYTKEDTRRKLLMQLESCVDNLNVAAENIRSTKEAMALAEKALSITQKRYEVGAGSSLELTSAENALTQSSLAYYQAIYNYIIAKNGVDEVIGNAYGQYVQQ